LLLNPSCMTFISRAQPCDRVTEGYEVLHGGAQDHEVLHGGAQDHEVLHGGAQDRKLQVDYLPKK